MYEAYYGLNVNPFRLAPDPHFFYESGCHKRGLAYLRYGLHQGQGFVVVTGVPGTGKSLLIQTMLAELVGQHIIVSSINNTNLEADDVLRTVANSLDIYCGDTTKAALLNALEKFLIDKHSKGQRVLLIVDEAQNLPLRSLEELRMLSNFQRGEQPLIQIMLLGQQQLQALLADPDMEQLSQRVIASCHLKPLSPSETRSYIEYRLSRAGWRGKLAFSGEALGLIHHISQGIPRIINTYCDRLLLAAYLDEKQLIDAAHVGLVLKELQAEAMGSWWGGDLSTVVPVALPPLPDGEFVAAEITTPDVTEAPVNTPEESPPAFESEPPLVEQVPLIVPLVKQAEKVVEPIFSDTAELGEESPPQTPYGNNDDMVAVPVPAPSEAISAVLPVQNEPVAAEIAQPRATPIPLVRTRSPLDDEGLPPESAYQGHHVRKARGRRVFVVVATLAVIVALPFVLFIGNDKPVSQVEAFLPESQSEDQNQSAALQSESESLMAESGVDGETSDIDTVALDEMVTMEQGGVEGATAESGAIVEISSAVTTPAPPSAPPSPPAAVVKVPVAQVQVTKPAVVAKVATPPAATLSPAAAEVKPLPALPAKTVPALVPAPKPVVQAAPVPVIVEPLPSPPVRVPEVPAESVKSQRDAAGVDVAALKPAFSDVDLTQLMYKFVLAYEGGDLGRLINLFASNATADGSMGHAKITRDYRELFQATDMRRMSLGTISWRLDGAVMHGTGDFEVTVWRRGDEDPTTMKGKLSIDVGKTDKQLEIRKLTHVVSR